MSAHASRRTAGRADTNGPPPSTTLVELMFDKRNVEQWIRFGRKSYERILDRRRSIVGFAPGSVFALVRWATGEHGTVLSRLDIVRAVPRGEPYQTLPLIRPGGDSLLRLDGWTKVQSALLAIDAVEALGLDAADASPDHWRHVHNRLSAGLEPTAYTPERHAAWIGRRRIDP